MWVRYCINPACHRPITGCNGSVVARDMLAKEEGERSAREIREICGRCVLWLCAKPQQIADAIFEQILAENPQPWSPT